MWARIQRYLICSCQRCLIAFWSWRKILSPIPLCHHKLCWYIGWAHQHYPCSHTQLLTKLEDLVGEDTSLPITLRQQLSLAFMYIVQEWLVASKCFIELLHYSYMTFVIFYILLSLNLWAKLWPSISCSNSLTLTRKAALVVKWQLMQRCSFPLQKQQISGDQKVWGQGAAAWESSCRLALRCDFPNHARFKEWDDGVRIIEWASSSSFSSMSFAWVRACWWSSFWHAVEKTEAKQSWRKP